MPDTRQSAILANMSAQYSIHPAALEGIYSGRIGRVTSLADVAEAQSRWRGLFQSWDANTLIVRPEPDPYPPYNTVRALFQGYAYAVMDRSRNRYGELNTVEARNSANVRTESIVSQLMEQLERLFGGGRFGGQNRDWLRRGLEAAGRLGMAGAAGGPYVAIATAVAGFVASVVQDLWPGRKVELLNTWRGMCRELTTLERYLILPYLREIFLACARMEPGYADQNQPGSDVWRWGTQPQPFGHNIVGAGPLGLCTFIGEIMFEYDCLPEPVQTPVQPAVIEAARAQAVEEERTGGGSRIARNYYAFISAPDKTAPDPLYVAYCAACLVGDHPPNFYVRDLAHLGSIYNNPSDPRGSPWVRAWLYASLRDRTVAQIKAMATASGLAGMSPTFYTHDIDRQLVDTELPEAGR